jgi:membrane protein DedA with SNARE-associated domain
LEVVLTWVSTYGYAAIFCLLVFGIVGLPVPDEWLLVFSGYLAFSGRLSLSGVLASAFLGSSCGITCSYLLGRKAGLPLLHSRFGRIAHITDERIHRIHDWFNRIGHWALFIGYFIPGVRHFTALVAGTSCLEYRAFAAYAYSGALVWVCTFVYIGHHFGENWRSVLLLVEANLRSASIIGLAILLCYAVLAYFLRRKNRRLRH